MISLSTGNEPVLISPLSTWIFQAIVSQSFWGDSGGRCLTIRQYRLRDKEGMQTEKLDVQRTENFLPAGMSYVEIDLRDWEDEIILCSPDSLPRGVRQSTRAKKEPVLWESGSHEHCTSYFMAFQFWFCICRTGLTPISGSPF